ncbi:MAG: glycosyltransferase family 39 protein [Rhodobacteraceae bacterium]|nr:glycosyltransferase family 39 protein [Paracoccaceae bacterium]
MDTRARPEWQGLAAILVASLVLRLVYAWLLPLGVDEAYAIAVARDFSPAFFDHPPLGFWAPVAAAALLGEHVLVYRLPALVLGTITVALIWAIGRNLGGSRAGLWAAALFGFSPYGALGAGTMVLPDAPLMAAGAGMALVMLRLLRQPAPSLRLWALAGALLGVAMASKYQAVLWGAAFVVWMLAEPGRRRLLLTPGPWLAACIALLGLVPVLAWNMGNGWASLAFHGGRAGGGLSPGNFAAMAAGQAVYLLPPVLVAAIIGLRAAFRPPAPERARALAALALWTVVFFNLIYLFSENSLPHWTMPGWALALPLAGWWLARCTPAQARVWRRWSLGLGLAIWAALGLVVAHLQTGLLTRGAAHLPAWDSTLDAFDWSGLRPELERRGLLEGGPVLLTESWITAGQMATALGGWRPVRVLGNAHHFAFLPDAGADGPALLLVPVRIDALHWRAGEALALAQTLDPAAQLMEPVVLPRGTRDYAAVLILSLALPAGQLDQ